MGRFHQKNIYEISCLDMDSFIIASSGATYCVTFFTDLVSDLVRQLRGNAPIFSMLTPAPILTSIKIGAVLAYLQRTQIITYVSRCLDLVGPRHRAPTVKASINANVPEAAGEGPNEAATSLKTM